MAMSNVSILVTPTGISIQELPIKSILEYKKIVYSQGVTTVLWKDGTKTTVRCSPDETANPGAGIAYAFMKKALGNGNAHNKILRKEAPKLVEAEIAKSKKRAERNEKKKEKQANNFTDVLSEGFRRLVSGGKTEDS